MDLPVHCGHGIYGGIGQAFGAGGLMYSLGVVKEWTSGNRIAGAAELILASCMWTATICSILLAGGIL